MSAATDEQSYDAGFQQFLAALGQDEEAVPSDVLGQITEAMKKRYASPPVADLEAVLHRAVPVARARQLLFNPDSEDMALYPALLSGPPVGSPDNHPQAKLQALVLSVFYLVHSRTWERMKPFIENDGLRRLVTLVSHPNLYLASQAMQCLLRATDEELFPWHEPPVPGDGRSVRQGPDGLVWRKMFELNSTDVIPRLLRHQNPDTFPGSGSLALRLIAFLASWLRYHFTEDRVLRLSANLLALLKEWSVREGVSEEERQLALQLYEDFNRFPPADSAQEGVSGPQLGSGSGNGDMTRIDDPEGGEEEGPTVVREYTQVNHVQPSEAEVLREAGNEAYRNGDWSLAIARYTAALDVPVPAAELLEEGPRRARLLSNRAAAYLARAEAGGGAAGECDECGHLEGLELGSEQARARQYEAALLDCEAALDLEPNHAKSWCRKVKALYWLARYSAASEAAENATRVLSGSSDPQSQALGRDLQDTVAEIHRCMQAPCSGATGATGNLASDLHAATAPNKRRDPTDTQRTGMEALLDVTSKSPVAKKPQPGKVLVEEVASHSSPVACSKAAATATVGTAGAKSNSDQIKSDVDVRVYDCDEMD